MGKRITRTRAVKVGSKREEKRILVSVKYLLRVKLGLDPNPENLSEPQPTTTLEVVSYLENVVRSAHDNN